LLADVSRGAYSARVSQFFAVVSPLAAICLVVGGTLGCAGSTRDTAVEDKISRTEDNWQDPRDLSNMKPLKVDGVFCDRRGKRADQVDTNHDARADFVTLYEPGEQGAITCKQGDLNFDGRLDAFFHYADGKLQREQYDQDYDGRIDTGRYWRDGEVYLIEEDLNRDGYVDTWRRYDRGTIVRVETDRDFDGRADMFVHYIAGRIDRVGYDVDGNGQVDQWDHDAARRAALALDAVASARAESPLTQEYVEDTPDDRPPDDPAATEPQPDEGRTDPADAPEESMDAPAADDPADSPAPRDDAAIPPETNAAESSESSPDEGEEREASIRPDN